MTERPNGVRGGASAKQDVLEPESSPNRQSPWGGLARILEAPGGASGEFSKPGPGLLAGITPVSRLNHRQISKPAGGFGPPERVTGMGPRISRSAGYPSGILPPPKRCPGGAQTPRGMDDTYRRR